MFFQTFCNINSEKCGMQLHSASLLLPRKKQCNQLLSEDRVTYKSLGGLLENTSQFVAWIWENVENFTGHKYFSPLLWRLAAACYEELVSWIKAPTINLDYLQSTLSVSLSCICSTPSIGFSRMRLVHPASPHLVLLAPVCCAIQTSVNLLMFCSWFFSLEAPTHRVAGVPPCRSGPTAGRSPRLSLRPLNISTSQVGAGAHPVTARPVDSLCISVMLLSQLVCFFLSLSTP